VCLCRVVFVTRPRGVDRPERGRREGGEGGREGGAGGRGGGGEREIC
jgi:hypothetical protein